MKKKLQLSNWNGNLNVGGRGQSEEDHGALDSGDEAAMDDVITDVVLNVDDAVSDLTAEDGSEMNDEQDSTASEWGEIMDETSTRDCIHPTYLCLMMQVIMDFIKVTLVQHLRCGKDMTLRWRYIAISSNKYQQDVLLPRVDDAYQRHKKRCRVNPRIKTKLEETFIRSCRMWLLSNHMRGADS
ncbi:hypothetical protein PHMEG_00032738 [Phytophthora megakarya]|uniref:Uncharacterized protein n=1 Tax=Phytophthora megakarya TaxID=4795 RepID=A0A225UX99_9STRA|nr:hypothetical protein PHMEG_00032738 [Phytophthora megakarya]